MQSDADAHADGQLLATCTKAKVEVDLEQNKYHLFCFICRDTKCPSLIRWLRQATVP